VCEKEKEIVLEMKKGKKQLLGGVMTGVYRLQSPTASKLLSQL
jgi:hypothetical protein